MATEIKTWQIVDDILTSVNSSLIEGKRKEREDLEKWIKSNPEILGNNIALIGEQVQTKSGFLDFLGIDSDGNIIIVELKRDKLPREALAQAIDYASDIANWELDKFQEICQAYTGQNFEDYLQEKFSELVLEEISVNQVQRLLLVGFAVEESLSRMIEWLSDNYNLGINAIVLSYIKTSNGDELLSRTVIIPEEVEKEKANKKKFIIEMSNDPGTYDNDTLKKHLIEYLSKDMISSKRIKDYLLPILLEKNQVTREELKKEFVKRKAAPDETQAGYFLSLISSQLGQKRRDYLRQIISYEFPNYTWEKDNFKIKDEFKELVQRVLEKIPDSTS